jgi:hypothetical protein
VAARRRKKKAEAWTGWAMAPAVPVPLPWRPDEVMAFPTLKACGKYRAVVRVDVVFTRQPPIAEPKP